MARILKVCSVQGGSVMGLEAKFLSLLEARSRLRFTTPWPR
jgi:hypothetical protein